MEEQEITKEKLKNKIGISSATMAKLSKNEDVSMSTIQSLCDFFDCQPGAILSYEKEIDKNTTLFRLREEMEMKLKGGLYHQTQIRIAYNSNHMEGSRLTHDQTRYIFETNMIGVENEVLNVDDVIETANHFCCIDMIIDHAKMTLTEKFIINPKGTSISKLSKAKKSFTVKWKKQNTQTTGYRLIYSMNSKFKTGNKYVMITSNKTTSKSIKKLKAKKKYYIRICTYKTVGGTKYYSGWSSVKSVTTK